MFTRCVAPLSFRISFRCDNFALLTRKVWFIILQVDESVYVMIWNVALVLNIGQQDSFLGRPYCINGD